MSTSTIEQPHQLSQEPINPHMRSQPDYSLNELVRDIKLYLGDCSGMDASDINADYLISLMQKYKSDPNDWLRYFNNLPGKNYTRNAIENVNHKANILLLVWKPGKGSPIHDHANAHCVMKVLFGNLTETLYELPTQQGDAASPMVVKSEKTYNVNEVTYISDEIGLHRVSNPSQDQLAVSLHLYTPPNAADIGYNIYQEATGKASFIPQAQAVVPES
ncbi:cysteine dioxygenase [Aaosphaeria arxii CBS 175.79]|uniref:Cysteine dioxygenase n=1 Tax=Aaosphaeria arxii CBS 175.79 TaxID=1450172 RepID=A0A6A5Y6P7_9PLEO|nr:cysteine dioxygenase [Aaosphaeria arxii CBS 175.79]KAF2021235.1 cysteine dioxygenase [Aaosphaeria arxii CBS 175.79]